MARMEVGGRLLHRYDRDVLGQCRVERLGCAPDGQGALDVYARNLRERMDAGIRSACHGEAVERDVQLVQSPPELTFDGAEPRLGRPAAEVGAVVLDREPKPHRTIIAG